MKTFLKTVLGLFFAGFLFAQPGPPSPANQVARLTALLDLTATQASQITTILTNAQSSASTIHTTLQTDRTSLDTAITSNNSATIDQLSSAIGALEGQLLDVQSKAAAQIYALLTSAQQTKLAAIGGVEALGGGPGRGPGGPPRP